MFQNNQSTKEGNRLAIIGMAAVFGLAQDSIDILLDWHPDFSGAGKTDPSLLSDSG